MAEELNALRDKIDVVDKQLIDLLAARLALVGEVGEVGEVSLVCIFEDFLLLKKNRCSEFEPAVGHNKIERSNHIEFLLHH